HADRFVDDHAQGAVARGRGLPEELVGRLRVPADRGDRVRQVELAAVGERLAGVDRLREREVLEVLLEQRDQAQQDLAALGGVHAAPDAGVERGARGGDGAVDVLRIARGDVGELPAGGRVDALEGRAGDGGHEAAVEVGEGADGVGERGGNG